ncbi:hypothetical protein BaRGS_00039595 [Batillaria attramentaria]|uniref:Splicing factor 3A subunit 1 n=1 Tax=Batillaria attramentaria TaxID=370345 RepID=A0ABD0J2I8_9CAEN
MPSIDVNPPQSEDNQPQPEETTLSKPVIGIIYPPPEVRNIVDKTASFVARNGPEFENRIRQNEVNNPKFNFLNPTDAYHAYYQHKVKEFKEGKGQEPVAPKLQRPTQEPIKIPEVFVPKDPPAEFEFIVDPPSISAYELDVVKLTAQFVARNGRQFLTTVMQREQRNYLFDFLRPQHSLFNYFTKLVEQYTKILIPPKNLKEKLAKESHGYREILDEVRYRVEWLKFQEREKKKEEDALERERVAYAQIDWHDFVVVETVDFQQNETGNLPPPTTPDEVGARILTQERYERGEIAMDDAVEMEVESDEEGDEDDERDEDRIWRRNLMMKTEYPNHLAAKGSAPSSHSRAGGHPEKTTILKPSLLDRRRPRPVSDLPNHQGENPRPQGAGAHENWSAGFKMDGGTTESAGREQEQEEVLAAGSDIDVNLNSWRKDVQISSVLVLRSRRLVKRYGQGGQYVYWGEEKRATKVVWDDTPASMEKVSQRARENISIEEQIATIHKTKGLVPDEEKEKIGPAMPKGSSAAAPPPPPPTTTMAAAPPLPVSKPAPPPPPVSRPPVPQMAPRPMGMPPQGVIMMQGPGPMGMNPMGLNPMGMNPMMGMRPPMPPMQPMGMRPGPGMQPPQPAQPPPPSDEPPSKKQKTEDNLIPEDVFLQKNKGPVTLKVAVPNVADKPEWNLNGQTLDFTLPLTDTISVLKAKLNEMLTMPAGKQKLQYEGIFVKDSNTLAFYNMANGATVQLQMKERGGRKK